MFARPLRSVTPSKRDLSDVLAWIDVMPAPVNNDGRFPSIKVGGVGEPLTLAVSCDMRKRTRSAVTEIGGPGFAGAVSRTSTVWPVRSCEVPVHWEIRSDVNAVQAADRLTYFQDNACTTGNKLCGVNSSGNGISASAARSALRPFGAMRGDNTILYYTHSGQSTYDSLQTFFQSRFRNNLTLRVAYT